MDGHEQRVVRAGPVELRPAEYGVFVDGKRVHLTRREFEVLAVLAARPDAVVPRNALYERVWGGPMSYRNRSVDAVVGKIRLKFDGAAPDWVMVHTHFGIGYRFAPERRDRAEVPRGGVVPR